MSSHKANDLARQLAATITDSLVYKSYIEAQKSLAEDPNLKEKIRAFREKQAEINNKHFIGEEMPADQIKDISLEFAKLNTHKAAADFFRAEADFVSMFNEIQEIIQKEVIAGFID